MAKNIDRYDKRAKAFIDHFNIKVVPLSLFPTGSALERIEYVLHEFAHAFTMGFQQMPKLLSATIETTLAKYSEATNDSLEIDTSLVTQLTMVHLGLVKPSDLRNFAAKCAGALTAERHQDRLYYVLDEMEYRANDEAITQHVRDLATMMRGPLKTVLAIYSLPYGSRG